MYFNDIFKVLSRGTSYEHAVNSLRTTDVIHVGLKLYKFTNKSNDFHKLVASMPKNSDKFSFSREMRCDLGSELLHTDQFS